MNFLASLTTLTLLATGQAQQLPFALETDTELSSAGDFNGDGLSDLVLVDRATGSYRVLAQAADGTFAIGTPRADWRGRRDGARHRQAARRRARQLRGDRAGLEPRATRRPGRATAARRRAGRARPGSAGGSRPAGCGERPGLRPT